MGLLPGAWLWAPAVGGGGRAGGVWGHCYTPRAYSRVAQSTEMDPPQTDCPSGRADAGRSALAPSTEPFPFPPPHPQADFLADHLTGGTLSPSTSLHLCSSTCLPPSACPKQLLVLPTPSLHLQGPPPLSLGRYSLWAPPGSPRGVRGACVWFPLRASVFLSVGSCQAMLTECVSEG